MTQIHCIPLIISNSMNFPRHFFFKLNFSSWKEWNFMNHTEKNALTSLINVIKVIWHVEVECGGFVFSSFFSPSRIEQKKLSEPFEPINRSVRNSNWMTFFHQSYFLWSLFLNEKYIFKPSGYFIHFGRTNFAC